MKNAVIGCAILALGLPFYGSLPAFGQEKELSAHDREKSSSLTGKYGGLGTFTTLELHADSTFELNTPDEIFSYTFQSYRTRGTWTASGDTVRLNPDKQKRLPRLSLTERTTDHADSLTIKINYTVEWYQNDSLQRSQPKDFHMLTVFVNSYHRYRNLVRQPVRRNCSFAPRIRKQVIVDSSSNTLRFPKTNLKWIAVNTYGLNGPIRLPVIDPASNYLEVNIVQPVDEERTPRNKMVIVKGKNAYYYELHGKVRTSGLILQPLVRR